MNKDYEVYKMDDEMLAKLNGELTDESAELREDAARFDGYAKAFEKAKAALDAAERPNSDLTRRRTDA